MRINWGWWLRLTIGVVLLGALVPILTAPTFVQALRGVDLGWAAVGLGLSTASVISKVWRWGVVLRWRQVTVPRGYLLESYFISIFFNNFLPSGMGGDVVRAVETARDSGRGKESIVSVIIERASGMLALFAAGSVGALFVPTIPLGLGLLAHSLFLGAVVGIWALWLEVTGKLLSAVDRRLPQVARPFSGKLIRLYEEFRLYRHEWRLLATMLGQSSITLAVTLGSVYAVLLAFGEHVPFGAFAAVFSIITAIDVIPFSLNGLGLREGSYVYLLGLLGLASPVALGVALVVRLIVTLLALVGGVVFLWRTLRMRRVAPR